MDVALKRIERRWSVDSKTEAFATAMGSSPTVLQNAPWPCKRQQKIAALLVACPRRRYGFNRREEALMRPEFEAATTVERVRYDANKGAGAMSYGMDIAHFGMTVLMRPSVYLSLVYRGGAAARTTSPNSGGTSRTETPSPNHGCNCSKRTPSSASSATKGATG
jgi:hypothetical protein